MLGQMPWLQLALERIEWPVKDGESKYDFTFIEQDRTVDSEAEGHMAPPVCCYQTPPVPHLQGCVCADLQQQG